MAKKSLKIKKRRTPEQLKEHTAALVARLSTLAGIAPYTGESRKVLRARCGRKTCTCPHLYPCEAGWLEQEDGTLMACQHCRPEVRAVQVATKGDRITLQDTIRDPQAREQAQAAHGWD